MEPEDVDSVLDRANRLLEAGRPAESLRCLAEVEGALIDSDDRIEHASLRAFALSEMGRDEEALQSLQPLLDEFPQSPRLLGALGVVLSGTNDLEQARAALESAVALDQQDDTLLANLALVYEKLHDYRTALKLYDRAIKLGADLDWALQRRAAALIESGQTEEGKATLKRYLSLAPQDAGQWVALAILHSDDAEYAEAFEAYRAAEQIDPDAANLRLNWGVTAVRAGHQDVARQQLEHLRRVDPGSSRPLLLYAFILEEEGDLRAAVRCYQKALGRASPQDPSEQAYAFEMAMDFFARRGMRARCERLLRRAYLANTCTMELCEAYRELTGHRLRRAYWFNLIIEADYRPGLCEEYEHAHTRAGSFTRFQRSFQVVASDRDEATRLVLEFARRMGETRLAVCEFVREEPLEDTCAGVYEVERESLVLRPA